LPFLRVRHIEVMSKFTFRKEERLNKEIWIQELFTRGSSFHLYPFKVLFLPHPDEKYPVTQILISVPKRNFKKAVDRNTIKRRIREAYRLNKHTISASRKWLIAYIYTAKDIQPSQVIHAKLPLTFERFK
jgi:ribonuclease P protein component